MLPFYTQTQG